jgi:hypothetical protein
MTRRKNATIYIISEVLSLFILLNSLGQPIHAAVHTSGYNHGCSDAQISNPSDRYINQPEKGPSFHTNEFMNSYHEGFNACSGSGGGSSGGENEFSSNSRDQSGFSLTVKVTSHPFGYEHVYLWVLGANGFSENRQVSTAGGASWTFTIPPDQGNYVRACAAGSIVSSLVDANCVYVRNTGEDKIVRLSAR